MSSTAGADNPNVEILGNQDPARRISIISFNLKDHRGKYLHPKFVTTLLNDLFGIQTRAGCSCAGPYGHRLLDIDFEKSEQYRKWIGKGFSGIKPGWCRISMHYAMDDIEADYIWMLSNSSRTMVITSCPCTTSTCTPAPGCTSPTVSAWKGSRWKRRWNAAVTSHAPSARESASTSTGRS